MHGLAVYVKDGLPSINPSANAFVFGGFNVHLVELIDLVNSVLIFLSQMTSDPRL